jgi:hypothetical protein
MRDLTELIFKGEFVLPPFLSREVCSLISGLLVQNPAKRLSICQMLIHPWLDSIKPVHEPVHQEPMSWRTNEIREDVVSKVETFGYKREYILTSLKMNDKNQCTTCYHLLVNAL